MIRPYATLPVETALAGRTVDRREVSIASFDGTQILLTILSPAGADLSAGNAPCVYWVHGGGMVMGDRYSQIDIPLDWLASFGAVVVSVDYRLAPDFSGMTLVEDCYAGLVWTAEHASDLGIDPARLVIAGNTSPASVPDFEKQGGLVPLNDFPGGAAYIEARTGPGASVYKSPDGQYYQLPWKSNPVMIFYNKKEFAKAGISTTNPPLSTYSQFLATARKLVSSGAAKYAIYPSPSSEFFEAWYDFYPLYAAQSGGKELVENNNATFDSPAGQAVAGFWRQLYAQNLAGDESYNGDPFADGTAAMAIVGPWAIANLRPGEPR